MFKPLNGLIIGKLIEDTTTIGKIVIPAASKHANLRRGVVVAVAPDAYDPNSGTEPIAKVGQVIYFPGPEANEIVYRGEVYFCVGYSRLLGITDANAEDDKPVTVPDLRIVGANGASKKILVN